MSQSILDEMRLVKAGNFLSGLTEKDIDLITIGYPPTFYNTLKKLAFPQRKVNLESFYIGTYPITNSKFDEFVNSTGYITDYEKIGLPMLSWRVFNNLNRKNHPVVCMNRNDALAYCKWLSQKTGFDIRLPNRLEWEKAARGPEGLLFPWGNEFDMNKCNTHESHQKPNDQSKLWSVSYDNFISALDSELKVFMNSLPMAQIDNIREMSMRGILFWTTTPVDTYPTGISPYGCFDICGNVREWVIDDWQPITSEQALLGTTSLTCGGGWSCKAPFCCPSCYASYAPDVGLSSMGFRIVISKID